MTVCQQNYVNGLDLKSLGCTCMDEDGWNEHSQIHMNSTWLGHHKQDMITDIKSTNYTDIYE